MNNATPHPHVTWLACRKQRHVQCKMNSMQMCALKTQALKTPPVAQNQGSGERDNDRPKYPRPPSLIESAADAIKAWVRTARRRTAMSQVHCHTENVRHSSQTHRTLTVAYHHGSGEQYEHRNSMMPSVSQDTAV